MMQSPLLCVGVYLLELPQCVSGFGLVLEAKLCEMLLKCKTEIDPNGQIPPSIVTLAFTRSTTHRKTSHATCKDTSHFVLLYTIPDSGQCSCPSFHTAMKTFTLGIVKEHLNIVLIGQVDAGKSAMGSNLLYFVSTSSCCPPLLSTPQSNNPSPSPSSQPPRQSPAIAHAKPPEQCGSHAHAMKCIAPFLAGYSPHSVVRATKRAVATPKVVLGHVVNAGIMQPSQHNTHDCKLGCILWCWVSTGFHWFLSFWEPKNLKTWKLAPPY
ncbi:hypothetical protein BC826DRAFT_1178926 [Russula brevipes]|nr:hypothetical protein BC826DRAFT_1178926 [Russula brevipes]